MTYAIYIGGCQADYLEVRKVQDAFKKINMNISYDWTIDAEKLYNGDKLSENIKKPDKLKQKMELDIEGINNAEWSLFVVPKNDNVYKGSYLELGESILRDKINKKRHTIVLTHLDDNEYAKSLASFYHPAIIHVNNLKHAINIIQSPVYTCL